MRKSILPSCRGVTLIELMVTIVVLGILAAMAAPTMNDVFERRRLIGATEAVYDQLLMARSEAIKQSRDTYVRIQRANQCLGVNDLPDPTATRCNCTQTDSEEDDACTLLAHGEEDRVLNVLQLANFRDVSIDLPTATTDIRFNFVRGIVDEVATPFGITLSTPKYELRVVVNFVGRVSICVPSGSLGGYPSCS
jgi:type IV fimbrial biogenesis protein FimT